MQSFIKKSLDKHPKKVLIAATIIFMINLFIVLMSNEGETKWYASFMLGFTMVFIGEAAFRLLN